MEYLQRHVHKRHNESSEPSSSTFSLESESSSEEKNPANYFCTSSKTQIKMKIEGNKTSPCYINQYTRVFSQNSGKDGNEMKIEETCKKGEIKNNICKLLSKTKCFLGIKKNSKKIECKKKKMCVDLKKNLKRISCQTGVSNSNGWFWNKNEKIVQNQPFHNQKFRGNKPKPKIKRKIVYKDEDGNVIDPNLIENGEYIPKDQYEKKQ